jgi:uncharacterized damage-inducible protein DinB
VTAEEVRLHLEYNAWASVRLLDAADTLSDAELARDLGTADKCVLGTLVHVFGADRIWLGRVREGLQGERPGPEFHDLAVLRGAWPDLHRQWQEWAAPLTDADLQRVVSYRDLRGNPWKSSLWKILLHVVNHGTHHRGQAVGFMRSLGHTPPPLDLITYYRTEAPDA